MILLIMRFIADFADPAVLMPLAVTISFMLFVNGAWRQLLSLLAALLFVAFCMIILKFFLFACGGWLYISGIHSPSGHIAGALIVLGGGVSTISNGRLKFSTQFYIISVLMIVLATALLILGTHTIADIVIGAFVGLIGLSLYIYQSRHMPLRLLKPTICSAFIVVTCFHGNRVQTEDLFAKAIKWDHLPAPVACGAALAAV